MPGLHQVLQCHHVHIPFHVFHPGPFVSDLIVVLAYASCPPYHVVQQTNQQFEQKLK